MKSPYANYPEEQWKTITKQLVAQAAMIEELAKQTTTLKEEQEKSAKSNKTLLPMVVVTMVITIANIAITIARILGLF